MYCPECGAFLVENYQCTCNRCGDKLCDNCGYRIFISSCNGSIWITLKVISESQGEIQHNDFVIHTHDLEGTTCPNCIDKLKTDIVEANKILHNLKSCSKCESSTSDGRYQQVLIHIDNKSGDPRDPNKSIYFQIATDRKIWSKCMDCAISFRNDILKINKTLNGEELC